MVELFVSSRIRSKIIEVQIKIFLTIFVFWWIRSHWAPPWTVVASSSTSFVRLTLFSYWLPKLHFFHSSTSKSSFCFWVFWSNLSHNYFHLQTPHRLFCLFNPITIMPHFEWSSFVSIRAQKLWDILSISPIPNFNFTRSSTRLPPHSFLTPTWRGTPPVSKGLHPKHWCGPWWNLYQL